MLIERQNAAVVFQLSGSYTLVDSFLILYML